jgi:hypothetical protein
MTTAEVLSKIKFPQILNSTQQDYLSNPMLPIAQSLLYARPSTSILFAIIGSLLHGAIAVGGYAFLCSFAITGMLAFYGLLLQIFGRVHALSPTFAALFAGAYACGFWGQYPLDIDAWSQVAVTPLLLSAWTIIFTELAALSPRPESASVVGPTIALAVLIAGAIYLYPEGAFFHALIIAGVVVAAGRPRLYRLRVVGMAFVLGLSSSALFWGGTLGFGANQSHIATSLGAEWWRYYDAYLFGMDPGLNQSLQQSLSMALSQLGPYVVLMPSSFETFITGTMGVLGTYFLTPEHSGQLTTLDGAKGVLLVVILVGLGTGIFRGLRNGHRGYRLLLISAIIGLFGSLAVLQLGQVWSAGKALAYAAPLFCLAIVAPAMLERKSGWGTWIGPLSWSAAQACFVGMCLFGLFDTDGIRLRAPYPEIQDAKLKTNIHWDISDQLTQVRNCQTVKIVAPDPIFRHLASLALNEYGKRYVYDQPVNTHFGLGQDIGHLSGKADGPRCEVVQLGGSLQISTDYSMANENPAILTSGLSVVEPWGRWSDGSAASVTLALDQDRVLSNPSGFINLTLRSVLSPNMTAQEADVWWGDGRVSHFEISQPQKISLPYSEGDWNGGATRRMTLSFDFPTAFVPRNAGTGSNDSRELSIGFEAIDLTRVATGKIVDTQREMGLEIATTYSLANDPPAILTKGLSVSEPWGRWADGKMVDLTLALKPEDLLRNPQGFIDLDLRAALGPQMTGQSVVIQWGNGRLAYMQVASAQRISLPYSEADWTNGVARRLMLHFELPTAFRPSEAGIGSTDSRELSLGFEAVKVGPNPSGKVIDAPSAVPEGTPPSPTKD